MKKKYKFQEIINATILILFIIGILGWLIWSIYQAFWMPEKPAQTIKFEVTGVLNSENASTLVQIHYECIKYCLSHVQSSYPKDCWEQCSLLGQEGCKNG